MKNAAKALVVLALSMAVGGCLTDGIDDGLELSSTDQEVAPPAPMALTVTNVTSTRQDLSWTPSPGATLYVVRRGFAPGMLTTYTSVKTTTFAATYLSPNTQYCWAIHAVNANGERSGASNEVCLNTSGTPTIQPPNNVIATPTSSSRITVSWDAVAGANKYFINRSSGGGAYVRIGTTLAPGTSYPDANLTAGTEYCYTVETVAVEGQSVASSPPACAFTFAEGLEGYWKFNHTSGSTATDLSGFNRNATLSGASFSTTAAPIDEKMNRSLQISSNAASTATVPAASSSAFVATGSFSIVLWVNPQATGDLNILGMRGAGCSTLGWQLAQDTTNNLYFRNPVSTVSFGSVLTPMTWTHIGVTYSGGTMRLYLNGAEVANAAFTTATIPSLPLAFGHPGGCAGADTLIDEAQYYSRQLTASELQVLGERPPAPANLVASQRSSTSMQLAWDPVSNAERYVTWVGTTSGSTMMYTSVPNTPSYIADHLAPDTVYYWQVQAVRNKLIGPLSTESSASTFPAPVAPSNLTGTAVSSTRVQLTWTAEPRAVKYFVNQSINNGPFVRKTSVLAPATSVQIANLTPGTTYAYTIQTQDNGGLTSAASAPVSVTTPQ